MDRVIMMEARRLAREKVRERLKEKGFKLQQFSFKQLCEQGEEYLRLHSELIDQAAENRERIDRAKGKLDH